MANDLEYCLVERPLTEQLKGMGWQYLEGAEPSAVIPTLPQKSGREGFDEVFLEDRLREAIYRINLDQWGQPWLEDGRIDTAVNALTRNPAANLLEANQRATELLIKGTTVDGVPGWDNGRARHVKFIDWNNFQNNDFVVVNQFRVDIPGVRGALIVPDVVLFVNGIPLVVVECKATTVSSLDKAVGQLRRYAEQVTSEVRTGNQKLFQTVQLTAVTSGEDAKLGTFTGLYEHYVPWRDPHPVTKEELAERLGKTVEQLSRQEILVAGVFDRERLLDIVHNYVTFMTTDEGKTVKVAPRYQQFRAVHKTVKGLLDGKTRRQDGKRDRRGGIIWHTQGSGKSLTMAFLVRKLRTVEKLKHFKVVLLTDRKQLQRQLSETLELAGEKVDVAKSGGKARALLSKHGPGLVFVMMQKNQEGGRAEGVGTGTEFDELNTDDSIVLLIDEAHRSQAGTFAANLDGALPNAAKIGFTGTPIMTKRGQRKTSLYLFGQFIDKYRLKEAEEDGVIVPILYEGHTVKGAVTDGRDLDEIVEEELDRLTEEERDQLQRRYATKGQVSVAERLINAKAKHMLRHYVEKVLPDGFKAQVVAHDREATVRYRAGLMAARDELVKEIEKLSQRVLDTPSDELKPRQAFLVNAHRQLDLLKRMEFVPVISEGTSENEERYEEWTDEDKQKTRTESFKRSFAESNIGFVIVNAMLLTGFDAPIEQVMYLDRNLQEHDLLQAVARVNRTADGKTAGYVVDYRGVAKNLLGALRIYAQDDFDEEDSSDVVGALRDLQVEIAKLEPQRNRLRMMFSNPDDIESCVQQLADAELRERFGAELTVFLKTINAVLPDPAAKPFLADVKRFTVVRKTANRRYNVDDGEFDPAAYGAKIRALIDEHITSLGIDQKLPPMVMTAPDFAEKVDALPGSRAKASTMEHTIRHHITVHRGEDPHRYQKLSERLEEILQQLKDDWDQQVIALQGLIDEMTEEQPQNPHGLGPVEGALYRVLLDSLATSADEVHDVGYAEVAVDVHALAARTIHRRDFWGKGPDIEEFRRTIFGILYQRFGADLSQLDKLDKLATDLRNVIKSNQDRIPAG